MSPIRHILCPSDDSASARRAFDVSLALARRFSGHVRAVHVAPPAPVAARGALSAARAASPDEDPCERLDGLLRSVGLATIDDVRADAAVFVGDVIGEIVREAREWPADLVVMGTRGRRGDEEWAVGSATEGVIRRSPCPVLSVPEPPRGVSLAAGAVRFDRILCPMDFSVVSERALEWTLTLARETQARVVLLHVLEWFPEEISRGDVSIPEYRLDLSEGARERLKAVVPADARRWCEQEGLVVAGKPHRQILRAARERGADLIVLGIHGRRDLDRRLSGGTICHVVREASCPVLVVPAGD